MLLTGGMPTAGTARPDPVDYMAKVAATTSGVAYKRLVLARLDLNAGQRVLDVGCGPGTDLTSMSEGLGDGGLVVGVDHDQRMLTAARRRTATGRRVVVAAGDAHHLPLRSGSVDRARTDRALQHVTDPARAIGELRRVLRPGGLAVVAEPDWGTLAIDTADAAAGRAFVEFTCDQVVRNALLGRQVARLAATAGFEIRDVAAVTTVFRDFDTADKILGLRRNAASATDRGYLTVEQAGAWLAALEAGPMLASVTLFVTTARA